MIVTFASHYGAMLMKRKIGAGCSLHPVPRFLSSSCGTCAVVNGHALEEIKEAAGEYLEAVYVKSGTDKEETGVKENGIKETGVKENGIKGYVKIYEYGKEKC